MDDFDKELKIGFLDEATQAVSDVEQCFLDLESKPNDQENLNKIFRLAHNLKGSSKAVGFDAFGEFTHEFESFILKVKNGEFAATPKVVNLLLRANDHIAHIIRELKNDLNATLDSTALLQEMTTFSEDSPPAEVILAMNPVDELEGVPAIIGQKSLAKPSTVGQQDESLRVSLSKVESLINYVGEMVILQSVLREQVQMMGTPLLAKTVQQLGKVSKEIQDISMGLRMVPIKPTFQKMQRIVRDTAQTLQKDVAIHLVGEETELDKTVLEKINDPLVHLIRNSVDHGIEPSEVRVSKGKNSKGQVTLSASHQAGKLVLEVKDDGAGLDPEKLKNKAIEKGILKADAELTEKEALSLIFAPGFSTKELVTDVSGRGVGMDVVKTNIHDLGGEVLIESKIGQGTVFRIILPLTLAIIDAMVLTYSQEKFVVPLNHVFETLKPETSLIKSTPIGDILLLREENLPLYRLGDFFGIKNSSHREDMIAIVIKSGPKPFAILVDDIIGQFQIVTKQLGVEIQGMTGISGSTILGDGKPAMILEPQDLLNRKFSSNYVQKPLTPSRAGAAA